MPVSKALERSANDFNKKYDCGFDFATFEARVEEYTFLRPNNGWIDVYKMTFDKVYKKSLEKAAVGSLESLNAEAMLDDFEYTLIRPFVNESKIEIKHKPYVGMDRIDRIGYLDQLTGQAPSNPVGLLFEKYRRGDVSLSQMRRLATSRLLGEEVNREDCVEIAGYVKAIEGVSQSRSLIWRTFHPLKRGREKKGCEMMKKMLIDSVGGGEDAFEEFESAAYETFEGYKRVHAGLAVSMTNAKEELERKQKMNDAMREPVAVDTFVKKAHREVSARVERNKTLGREKQL